MNEYVLKSSEPLVIMTESELQSRLDEAKKLGSEDHYVMMYLKSLENAIFKLMKENANDYQLRPHISEIKLVMEKYGKLKST